MKRPIQCIAFCILFLFLMPGTALSIKVGVAEVDISPENDVILWGYSKRKDLSTGIYDPLMARAVVFDDGASKASIVVMDVGRTFPRKELDELRAKLQEKYRLSQVLISAVHTHSAPGYYMEEANQEWKKMALAKVDEVVGRALRNSKKAQLKTAEGEMDITYERRVFRSDGSVKMLWENFDREFIDEIDQTVKVLFAEDMNGKPLVTMVHYACHPVMEGSKNLKVSADFPAYMDRIIVNELGGMSMFVQGATGNINPYLAGVGTRDTINGFQRVKEEGARLGQYVVKLYDKATPVRSDDLEIQYSEFSQKMRTRYPAEDERIKSITKHLFHGDPGAEFYFPGVSILTLGDQFAWAGFPGEFFDDFQVELYKRSPFRNTYFAGYCNGHYSYFPTIEAAAKGGYGADYNTLLESGAGEILVGKAVVELYKLSGKLEGR